MIRAAIRGDDKPLQQFAESLAKLDIVDQDTSRDLLLESFVEFVDVLTDDFSLQECVRRIRSSDYPQYS